MIKEWKGKATDVLIVYGIYLFFVTIIHIASAIQISLENGEDIISAIVSFPNFLWKLVLVSILMSPMALYLRKIPKTIIIDTNTRTLIIERKKKSKPINLDINNNLSYSLHSTIFYSVIEIYGIYQTTRGHSIKKKVLALMVPNIGLFWNKKVLTEIQNTLESLNVSTNSDKPKSFWKYLYD